MSRFHLHIDRRAWARARRAALDRDNWRCCQCGRAGRLEVDHIRPLARGGDPLDLDNLQSLCKSCHFAKTRAENDGPIRARFRAFVDEFSWELYT